MHKDITRPPIAKLCVAHAVAELHNYCCFRRWCEANSMTSSTCTSRHQRLWLTGLCLGLDHAMERNFVLPLLPTMQQGVRDSIRGRHLRRARARGQRAPPLRMGSSSIVAPATLPPTLRSPSAFAFTVYFAVAGLGRWAMAVGLGDARQGCLDAGIGKNRRGRERKQGEMGLEGGKTWVTMQNCMPCCHAMSAKEC